VEDSGDQNRENWGGRSKRGKRRKRKRERSEKRKNKRKKKRGKKETTIEVKKVVKEWKI